MIHTLHLNDHDLVVQSASSAARSQGYAWLKGDRVLFDCNSEYLPVENCRLAPQQINSRYWQQCEQSSIGPNEASMRHAADLIWRHLSELKDHYSLGDVVLVVPSHYQSANLQLLLGIAKSSGLRVVGLLNKAVAALHDKAVAATGECVHVDVQLHQTVCTQLTVGDRSLKSGAVEVLQGVGIQSMQDALLKALQESFIQNDRFDPLHYAETEQQLFDQLDAVATELQNTSKAVVTVRYQDRLHRTSIDSKLWSATLAPFFEQFLAQNKNTDSVFVDTNGVFDNQVLPELLGQGVSIKTRPENLELLPEIVESSGDQAIVYRTELARKASKASKIAGAPKAAALKGSTTTLAAADKTESDTVKPQQNTATHLLQFGIAVPIASAELRTDTHQLSLHSASQSNVQALLDAAKIFIMNDESRKHLKPNDRLGSHLADGVITVIQVV